jgi:eukaryotic-like serine/threonine-protein kinase
MRNAPPAKCDQAAAARSVTVIDLLRGTAKYDLAWTESFDYVYPAYIRGLAYLEPGDGRSAAAQFQKMIDNRGLR